MKAIARVAGYGTIAFRGGCPVIAAGLLRWVRKCLQRSHSLSRSARTYPLRGSANGLGADRPCPRSILILQGWPVAGHGTLLHNGSVTVNRISVWRRTSWKAPGTKDSYCFDGRDWLPAETWV